MNEPWDVSEYSDSNTFHNPFGLFISFFKKYISAIDGDRCPMYPTCSQYSLLCLKKHGVMIGWIMTCDRLLHEGDEIYDAPIIQVYDNLRYYDPVENNDFWWYHSLSNNQK